jgi:hypothetical protein
MGLPRRSSGTGSSRAARQAHRASSKVGALLRSAAAPPRPGQRQARLLLDAARRRAWQPRAHKQHLTRSRRCPHAVVAGCRRLLLGQGAEQGQDPGGGPRGQRGSRALGRPRALQPQPGRAAPTAQVSRDGEARRSWQRAAGGRGPGSAAAGRQGPAGARRQRPANGRACCCRRLLPAGWQLPRARRWRRPAARAPPGHAAVAATPPRHAARGARGQHGGAKQPGSGHAALRLPLWQPPWLQRLACSKPWHPGHPRGGAGKQLDRCNFLLFVKQQWRPAPCS